MFKAVRLACVLAFAGTMGACASVTRGWNEQIQIVSEPSGAEVRTSLSQACVTPCTLQVSRKDEFIVEFAKPGYRPQTIPVNTRVAGAGAAGFAGNVLVGGIVGMGVDAASGATLEHFPNPVVATLVPIGPPPRQTPPARGKKPPPAGVVQRMAPAPVAPVNYVPPAEPEPTLSEADRVMNMRN